MEGAEETSWWFAAPIGEYHQHEPIPSGVKRISPPMFRHYREVLEHKYVMLYAETTDGELIHEPVEVFKYNIRVYARTENQRTYELADDAWISSRSIQDIETIPLPIRFVIDIAATGDFPESDRILVINDGDGKPHFYRTGV